MPDNILFLYILFRFISSLGARDGFTQSIFYKTFDRRSL